MARAVAGASIPPDLAALTREEGTPILRSHYEDVSRRFREEYPDGLEEQADREALEEALAGVWDERAREQAGYIAETDARDAETALRVGELERERVAAEDGTFLGRASVAAIVGTALLRRMQARRPGITTLETQGPAEFTKAALVRAATVAPLLNTPGALAAASTAGQLLGPGIGFGTDEGEEEAEPDGGASFRLRRARLVGRVARGEIRLRGLLDLETPFGEGEIRGEFTVPLPRLRVPRKSWSTVGDEVVREHHADAEGQTVEVDEAFLVKGEQLMYPGDTLRGASLDNVINCRCSAIYD